MQDKLKHSEIIMGDILNLQYFYSRIYAALTHYLEPENRKLSVMMIGGGGYVYQRYVEKMWPSSRIDVVEIDPAVTKAAIEAFGLEKATSIRTFHMDARNFVDELLAKEAQAGQKTHYDFIYEDAFNDYSVPYQLTTKEFNDRIFRLLSEKGAYLINMVDVFDSGMFLGAMISTLEQTFPYVYVFSEADRPHFRRGIFVVAASKRLIDITHFCERYKSKLRMWCLNKTEIDSLKIKANNLILTDDYAPVENLLAPVVP
jgi:spermidine synthase